MALYRPWPAGSVIVTGDFDNVRSVSYNPNFRDADISSHRSGHRLSLWLGVAMDSLGQVRRLRVNTNCCADGTPLKQPRSPMIQPCISSMSCVLHSLVYTLIAVFRFVVDGQWTVRDDLPKERNNEGIVNNVVRTPPQADATNATHHSEPVAEVAPTVNGIAPSAAEVAAEAGPEPTPEVDTSIPAQATAAVTAGAASAVAAAHDLVNGEPKVDAVETPAPTHGDPIKALADATAPSPITAVPIAAVADVAAAAKEFVAPTAEPTAVPQVLPVSQPIKDLADATAPSAAVATSVETVQNTVAAAHEFVNGGPLTPAEAPADAAAEVCQPIKALADATAPPAVIAVPVETVKNLGSATQEFVNGINGGTTAETPVTEKVEAIIPPTLVDPAATEALTSTGTTENILDDGEDDGTVITHAAELVVGAAAATSAAVLAAVSTEKAPTFEEPATTTTTSEPTAAAPVTEEPVSTVSAVASTVASNVGLAIKSLTGVDPINAAQVNILPLLHHLMSRIHYTDLCTVYIRRFLSQKPRRLLRCPPLLPRSRSRKL